MPLQQCLERDNPLRAALDLLTLKYGQSCFEHSCVSCIHKVLSELKLYINLLTCLGFFFGSTAFLSKNNKN